VAADQTGEGYEASDLVWAKAEGVRKSDGAVNLQMQHLMSKLTVNIVAGEDYIGSLPEDASVLLHSTVTGARVDLSKGSVSTDSAKDAEEAEEFKNFVQSIKPSDFARLMKDSDHHESDQ
jgi:hypothetical protein